MDTDRNLLFGVLALQAELITAEQFAEACADWSRRKTVPLAEILIERGWITTADRADVESVLEVKVEKEGSNATMLLASVADDRVRRVLATLRDPEIQTTLDEWTGSASLPPPPSAPSAGAETRDRYSLRYLHARGGIGRVWLARDADLGRDVALKELRPEKASSPSAWARLLQEARITGQLEHPGIVPVYELSRRSDDRQPFYTMRFIKGRTFTEAIREYHARLVTHAASVLDLRDLLNAFVAVCQAVAYAHARKVLHRDLKGQNVVLGEFGEVIVLDWGLAKLVDEPAEEPTHASTGPIVLPVDGEPRTHTIMGQAVGTPAYMAPEMAKGQTDQVGFRSDIYSLGTILYEILTGRPPYQGSDTLEVLRRVREQAPPPPRQVCPSVPPALESICLKALARQPADRYGSAQEVAREIQRWLADEPVEAHPESLPARAGRWARRHRAWVAAAAALLVLAVFGLSITTALVQQQEARAEAARGLAELNFLKAMEAVDRMLTRVGEDRLATVPGTEPLRRALLEDALQFYRGYLLDRGADPSVRWQAARAYRRMGDMSRILGKLAQAEQDYSEGIGILGDLIRSRPEMPSYRQDLAILQTLLSDLYRQTGRSAEAEPLYRRAIDNFGELVRSYPSVADYQLQQARAQEGLALVLMDVGRDPEAEDALRRAVAQLQPLTKSMPALPAFRQELARAQLNLAALLVRTGRNEEAEVNYAQAIALLEALLKPEPHHPDFRRELALALTGRGNLLAARPDRRTDAEADLARARTLLEALTHEFTSTPVFRRDLASTLTSQCALLASTGQTNEAEADCRQALALAEGLAAEFPSVPGYQSLVANALASRGNLELSRGRAAEAQTDFDQAIRRQQAARTASPRNPAYRRHLASHHDGLGRALLALGKHAEAAESAAQVTRLEPSVWSSFRNAAALLAGCAKLAENDETLASERRSELAESYARQAVSSLRTAIAEGLPDPPALANDPAFAPLADRDDFLRLLQQAPAGR